MFLYKGKKITRSWTHDDGRKIPKGWLEGATDAQLADLDVTKVDDIEEPIYDKDTQFITEQPDGSYVITSYTSEQLSDLVLTKRSLEYPSIKDVVVALAEKEEGNDAMWLEITQQRQAVKAKYPKQ